MIRSLVLVLLSLTWVQAIDLIAISNYATNEDTELIISYATLDSACTVNGGPADRYRIADLSTNGTIWSRATSGAVWGTAAVGDYLAPGSSVRFVPNFNVFGTKGLFLLRACLGSAESFPTSANIVIGPQPDPPVATAGTYSSVTEDTAFTFTHAILTTTLGISDPDLDTYTIKLVSRGGGTFDHPVGYQIPVGGSVTWTPPLNLYTKTGEPDVPVLTVQAVSTVNKPQKASAVVALKARITGVADPVTGVTALTSIDPIRMAPGTQTEYTYDQIHALARGTNDPDRNGSFYFQVTNAAMNGLTVTTVLAGTAVPQTIDLSVPSTCAWNLSDGQIIRFQVPTGFIQGTQTVGNGFLNLGIGSAAVPLVFDIRPAGGSTSGNNGGEQGGGCGVGSAGLFILLLSCGLWRRRVDHDK